MIVATRPDPTVRPPSRTLRLNILESGNHDSGVAETNIPDTETTFDWLDYH